jgi:hypothetical protein
VPLTRWATVLANSTEKGLELSVSSCSQDGTTSTVLIAGSVAFLVVLGVIARRLGLRAGLVAVAVTALSYGLAVWLQGLVFPDAACHVVMFGTVTGYTAREPVVAAAIVLLSAALAFAIATIGSLGYGLWRRLQVSRTLSRS